MFASRARVSPGASARLETTRAMVASSRRSAMASMIDCRLLPRPEMRTPRCRESIAFFAIRAASTGLVWQKLHATPDTLDHVTDDGAHFTAALKQLADSIH